MSPFRSSDWSVRSARTYITDCVPIDAYRMVCLAVRGLRSEENGMDPVREFRLYGFPALLRARARARARPS
jgi:hypothetical protein